MPYTIRKQPKGGYKVYTDKGKALSKKALPKARAVKQRIAVSLAEGIWKGRKKKVM